MFRRLSLVVMRNYCRIPSPVVSIPTRAACRSFYVSQLHRSNCDFGRPCSCSECMESSRKPMCEICKVHPTTTQSAKLTHDRKGLSGYKFTSFCDQCWAERSKEERRTAREKERFLALREERTEKMLANVRAVRSTEQVPFSYAIDKLLHDVRSVKGQCNSRRWHQRDLLDELSRDLQIVKVRNRYVCNKGRFDVMDFKLWSSRKWLEYDV